VLLVQALTGISEFTNSNLITFAQAQFQEPVRVGKALPGGTYNVRHILLQDALGLLVAVNSACNDHWRVETRLADRFSYGGYRPEIPPERALFV